jgi:hypothetical protein
MIFFEENKQTKRVQKGFHQRRIIMSKPKQTPSSQVDQKKLLDDKVEALRKNNFEDDHVRRVTQNGAQGQ